MSNCSINTFNESLRQHLVSIELSIGLSQRLIINNFMCDTVPIQFVGNTCGHVTHKTLHNYGITKLKCNNN